MSDDQLDLTYTYTYRQTEPRVLPTIDEAHQLGAEGQEQARRHAGEAWAAMAWQWLHGYLQVHRSLFPEDVWDDGLDLPPGGNLRALGPLIARAAREGLIVWDGATRVRRLGHGTPARVWTSCLYAG